MSPSFPSAMRGVLLGLTVLAVGVPAGAATSGEPPPRPSVLVMPIEPLDGVQRHLAQQVTGILVAEAGKHPGFKVQSFRELEGVLSQEQLKQAAGCDSVSCAAELAGALNSDQIVIGTLGKFGQSYLLTLSRVTAGSETVGRSLTKVPLKNEEALLTEMPATVKSLFGAVAPPPEQAASTSSSASEKKPPPAKGPTVGQQLGDAFGSLVKTGTSLINSPKGGQTLKSDNGTQAFVWIPAGKAALGCAPKSKCAKDEAPARAWTSNGFWLNKNEVTVKSYLTCVAAGVCPATLSSRDKPPQACNLAQKRLAHPMNCISYLEAQQYCEWEGGRLPSSDEWEYAARAGRTAAYPWGNDPVTGTRANVCDKQCAQSKPPRKKEAPIDDGFALTAPVGNFPQGTNPWGLQDLAGNVREWSFTEDKGHQHELLGGSYASPVTAVTPQARTRAAPKAWDATAGLRCVRLTPRPGKEGAE